MARWRSRDPVDLAWNDLRRRLTLQLDAEIRGVRERILNKILTAAWEEFQASLERGEVLQIESHVAAWVGEALEQSIDPKVAELDGIITDASDD